MFNKLNYKLLVLFTLLYYLFVLCNHMCKGVLKQKFIIFVHYYYSIMFYSLENGTMCPETSRQ